MPTLSAEDSAKLAIEAAKIAAETIEASRQALMEESDKKHMLMLKSVLSDIFGNESDNKDPEHMKVLVRRIPILCTNIENMHASIDKINDNITWVVRIVVGAFVMAVIAFLIK